MFTIYLIRNISTEKVYVGQSSNLKSRWSQHVSSLNRAVHHCTHLQRAWTRYGPEDFELIVVEQNLSEEDANNFEKELIEWYADLDLAYNPTWNHRGRGTVSEETRQKLRVHNLENGVKPPSRQGAKLNEEQLALFRLRMKHAWSNYEKPVYTCIEPNCDASVSYKGRRCRACYAQSRSLAQKGQALPQSATEQSARIRRDKPLSENHKAKQSAALQGKTPKNLDRLKECRLKKFVLLSPKGERTEVTGFTAFCRENRLHSKGVRDLLAGKRPDYKGWKRLESD